jgi:hypothetical protein
MLELLVLLFDPVGICILIAIAAGGFVGLAVARLGDPDLAPYAAGGAFLAVTVTLLLGQLMRERPFKKEIRTSSDHADLVRLLDEISVRANRCCQENGLSAGGEAEATVPDCFRGDGGVARKPS